MNVLEEAIIFATKAHEGQTRKSGKTPYILHPMEVANIIATVTDDLETMAAGVLHDTVEDCGVDPKEIREKFGPRVAALVQSDSEDRLSPKPPSETWVERKEESLLMLSNTKDIEVKKMWLGDKLSNIRSFYRIYKEKGPKMWENFHQKDPKIQHWYYKTIADLLSDLSYTDAYKEYVILVGKVFDNQI
ncbi:MAG: HD domain-containing protein [Clostridia bacterium]|nr:HD domain-containing protein [Clostridia bacterium]